MLKFTDRGIYCPQGDFYIDATRPVNSNIVTHAHADHARPGHKHYLAHTDSEAILKFRLGGKIQVATLPFGESIHKNGVKVSLHPAGHIVGSAQVRLEYKGEVWVVSGDYKLEDDQLSGVFEPIRCHGFITECTFGMPVYQWPDPESVFNSINQWWVLNREAAKTTVLCGYTLGKAQRLLYHIDHNIGPVFAHQAVLNVNKVLQGQGIPIPEVKSADRDFQPQRDIGCLILAPPSAINNPWIRKFTNPEVGAASGWMQIKRTRKMRNVDRGFVLSDHADWEGLNKAVSDTGAETIITTHGYAAAFARWLREKGFNALEAVKE